MLIYPAISCDTAPVQPNFHSVDLKLISASEMTYIVSGGAFNSTHSLTHLKLIIYY